MDLLDRARALAACPLFEALAPAVVVRLAERARVRELAAGEHCSTVDHVWIVESGELAGAGPGGALGMFRVVSPATPPVVAAAIEATRLVGLELDDVRDVLEEDPGALATLAEAVAAFLLRGDP